MRKLRSRIPLAVCFLVGAAALSACDIVTAEFKSQESAEWRRSYDLQTGGTVEINNVNGRINVEPAAGNKVEVVAVKVAKAASADEARRALERIEIAESASPDAVKVETRLPREDGWFNRGGLEVRYTVKVPVSANANLRTTNGGVEVLGLRGRVNASTTNGGITARDISGPIEASTTNGGIDVDLAQLSEGVTLGCTNGGIKLRLPAAARASISARITNGGINTDGLTLETLESSRRRLEARLNGGGPPVKITGTNGGIRIAAR